ncbi:hypothetical protein [[Haemophilus] ducreyi]|uniref:hypothetical protein n=1 Tax=Haemophilus ducreyi TaxID=730 RepID=UPI0008D7F303|nr:hypothetical protein [[Haemophilus] ducreyi]SEV92370.1 hypothetical protein SAMN02983000_0786 [[Haemophilus] ducreyi]VEG83138.1 Uncharacterised protein [[Haemophilus] ducreyi]
MKQILVKLATAFLERNGYIVRSKALCNLVPDFVIRMQQENVKNVVPLSWDYDH